MSSNFIDVIGLNYQSLFKNINISLEKNKFYTISGSNNCGKTTLIRLIDGQLYAANSIYIFGKKYEEYSITEIGNLIKTIIPLEYPLVGPTVEEELYHYVSSDIEKQNNQKEIKEIAKIFKLTKLLTKTVDCLSSQDIINLQLATSFISKPQLILIDDLSEHYTKNELLELTAKLKQLQNQKQLTVVMVTSNLDCNLLSDYTYIISNGEIVIEGRPLEVLEKDNIINKAGLNLPFMMDLSVKLRDYDLIKETELDMEKMVDTLWK